VNILEKQYFNLSEFLLGFQNTFKLLAYNKGMKLSVTSVDIEVYGDAKYLYRVMYNFIDNAIKFGNENTEVEVNAYLIDEGVRVSVKNYGKGIDADMISDIWDRYYKSSKSGGMGLGLAICSEILKLHDFKYGVMSSSGDETEFYYIIPI
jgi:signal transduction histidine kinase